MNTHPLHGRRHRHDRPPVRGRWTWEDVRRLICRVEPGAGNGLFPVLLRNRQKWHLVVAPDDYPLPGWMSELKDDGATADFLNAHGVPVPEDAP